MTRSRPLLDATGRESRQPADLRPVLHVQHLPIIRRWVRFAHTGSDQPGRVPLVFSRRHSAHRIVLSRYGTVDHNANGATIVRPWACRSDRYAYRPVPWAWVKPPSGEWPAARWPGW
jgi:hypothetical protein